MVVNRNHKTNLNAELTRIEELVSYYGDDADECVI
jgi:hypothetical protein